MWLTIISFTVLVIVAVDAWCFMYSGCHAISATVVEWTRAYPFLPFLVGLNIGILAGYFLLITTAQ